MTLIRLHFCLFVLLYFFKQQNNLWLKLSSMVVLLYQDRWETSQSMKYIINLSPKKQHKKHYIFCYRFLLFTSHFIFLKSNMWMLKRVHDVDTIMFHYLIKMRIITIFSAAHLTLNVEGQCGPWIAHLVITGRCIVNIKQ